MQSYDINIQGMKKLINKLEATVKESVIKSSLKEGGQTLAAWSRDKRLSGPRPRFLGVVTNRLRSSITAGEPVKKGNIYTEKIGTNVKYAPIHEFGGVIVPVHKLVLRWKGKDGKYVFSQRSIIPARPFLRPSIQDKGNQKEVLNIFVRRINEELKKNDSV